MSLRIGEPLKELSVLDLGLLDYGEVLGIQQDIVEKKIEEKFEQDILILVEHPAVFTLGKRGGRENLMVRDSFLEAKNIGVIPTTRGGNITFHGPGQLVLYPIIDLSKAKIGVADFVNGLEGIMIKVCSDFNIMAERNVKNHGIWANGRKIGSVGLAIKHGISFHGLALNVNIDLEPFSWINPCGIKDLFMTSIKQELNKTIDFEKVKKSMIRHWEGFTGRSL